MSKRSLNKKPGNGATLTDTAYREIEERIVTLQLSPGEVLSESMLVDALGIGRTPIREALQQLAREGLVIIMPRRGVIVSELDVRRQLELLKVRRELERLIASLLEEKRSERDANHDIDVDRKPLPRGHEDHNGQRQE